MKCKLWMGIGQVMGAIGNLQPNRDGIFDLADEDVKKLSEPASPYRIEVVAKDEPRPAKPAEPKAEAEAEKPRRTRKPKAE